jgi:hypothetical protein
MSLCCGGRGNFRTSLINGLLILGRSLQNECESLTSLRQLQVRHLNGVAASLCESDCQVNPGLHDFLDDFLQRTFR